MSRARRIPQATIPEPYADVGSLRATAMATKELVETLAGQRGDATDVAVTWGDLIRLGMISRDRVPKDIGQNNFQRP